MDRAEIMKLALFLVFLVWHPGTNSQWVPRPLAPRPLCVSQFALASHACALLPIVSSPPPSTPSPPSTNDRNESDEPAESDRTDNHRQNHGQGNKHDGHGHEHGRQHRRHRHRHRATPLEQDCCRWLGAIDSECVCDLLVYLPPFLSRPYHQYTVLVHDSCNVTFQCGSRIRV